MADDNKVGGRRFMNKLQDSIGGADTQSNVEPFAFTAPMDDDPPLEAKAYAPPSTRLAAAQKVTGGSRLQTIGQFVTALTYREAMAMGVGIAGKMNVGKDPGLSPEILTRAIQDWAWTWETFKEEERPVNKG
jgi:hypothetical protein